MVFTSQGAQENNKRLSECKRNDRNSMHATHVLFRDGVE